MQRRVEQADRDGEARHRLEDPLEVRLLHRQQLVERRPPAGLVARQDHLLHDGQPVLRHEHVLGAAEADALGAELARLGRVLGCVRVGAHAQPAQVVGPAEDGAEVLVDRRWHEPDRADDDVAGAAVEACQGQDAIAIERGLERKVEAGQGFDGGQRRTRGKTPGAARIFPLP